MRNTEKILNLLSQVIELARGITPAEGEIIFRSNIFIDVMSAVEQGNKGAKVSLAEKLEKQLGLGLDPLPAKAGLPLSKGESLYYIRFNEHSRWYGYYAEIWADNNMGAAQKAGELYGWLDWSNVQTEKPAGLELIQTPSPAEPGLPLGKGEKLSLPVHEVVDPELEEILEEAGKVAAGDQTPSSASQTLPLGKGEMESGESREARENRLRQQAIRNRDAFLKAHEISDRGLEFRG